MNELFFPVIGSLVVFLIAVPVLTVFAKGLLVWSPAAVRSRERMYDQPWRFSLIVAPTLGPVVWLVSAAVHQSEDGAPLVACIVDHLGSDICRDVVLFGLALLAILGFGALHRARRDRIFVSRERKAVSPIDLAAARARVQSICRAHPALAPLRGRIHVVTRGLAPACTRGLVRPRVEIEAGWVGRLSDDELAATLLHEVEHAHAGDPLRFFVAHVAVGLNPSGRLLAPELSRYVFSREALCDRRAVQHGADPLALARSIVSVATPSDRGLAGSFVAALGGHGIGSIRVRVQLLLGYAARRPGPATRPAPIGLATALIVMLAVMPHVMGTAPLDFLHHGIEHAVLVLGLG